MTGVRHTLSVFLAVAALLTALTWTSTALACPSEAMIVAQPMAHHHHAGDKDGCAAPARHRAVVCGPVCLGVLPALPAVEQLAEPHEMIYALSLPALDGIDPLLDPPPPRAA